MTKKYYAVKKGKTTGIFETWGVCKENVEGISGAQYKSFSKKEDAIAYLAGDIAIEDVKAKVPKQDIISTDLIAYVDGSYNHDLGWYSFGCVILKPDGEIIKENGYNDDKAAAISRNVAGELQGAMYAVRWAVQNGYDKIIIHHDYEGIAKWFNGDWAAKTFCSQTYLKFLETYRKKINIKFVKVLAHSGDKYNEMADELAKAAIADGKRANKGV